MHTEKLSIAPNGSNIPATCRVSLLAVCWLIVLPAPVTLADDPLPEAGPTPLTDEESIVLSEGDIIRISFPGSPNLDTTQTIRRDGRISLGLVGELRAAGLVPAALERQILDVYGSQLISKEVTVTVVTSAFPVYVTGAVSEQRSGKLMVDRPLTALQAIIEAGLNYRLANLRGVVVIRREGKETRRYVVNLNRVLEGDDMDTFQLQAGDIIFVPERRF